MPDIPKRSATDTTLTTVNAAGERASVSIPKGADVTLHTAGLHYNRGSCNISNPHLTDDSKILSSPVLEGSLFIQSATLYGELAQGCIFAFQWGYVAPAVLVRRKLCLVADFIRQPS